MLSIPQTNRFEALKFIHIGAYCSYHCVVGVSPPSKAIPVTIIIITWSPVINRLWPWYQMFGSVREVEWSTGLVQPPGQEDFASSMCMSTIKVSESLSY
jgi:hypothetical protein